MPIPSKMEVVATDSDDEEFEDAGVVTTDAANMEDDDGRDAPMPQADQHPFSFSSSSGSSSSSSSSVRSLKSSDLQSISGAPDCYHNNSRLNLNVGQVIRIDDKAYIVGISGLMPKLDNIYSVNSSSSSSSSNPTNKAKPRKKRRPRPNSPQQNSSSSSSNSSTQQQHHIVCELGTSAFVFYTDNSDPPEEIIQQYRVGDTILLNGTYFLIGANKRLWVSPKNTTPPNIPEGYSLSNQAYIKCTRSRCKGSELPTTNGINNHIAEKHAATLHECHFCGFSSRKSSNYDRHINNSTHLTKIRNFENILKDFINPELSKPAHHNTPWNHAERLLPSLENFENTRFKFAKMNRIFLKQEIFKILSNKNSSKASQANPPIAMLAQAPSAVPLATPGKKRRPSVDSPQQNSSSSSSSSSAPPSSSSNIGRAPKRRRSTQVSENSSPVMQPQHDNIPPSDSKSEIPSIILEHIKNGVTKRNGNKVTIKSEDTIRIVFKDNDGNYSDNKYRVEINGASISLYETDNGSPPPTMNYCLYCNYSIENNSNFISKHKKSDRHRINIGLPPLDKNKSYECTICNNYSSLKYQDYLLHRRTCQKPVSHDTSSQQHVPQDEMPTSHNTSSSSSSTSIKQEPTIKEEGNRSEDDMSDEDNGYSFFSSQSIPQSQPAGSPWVPFAEQRQVTNVDFPQEIIDIPSYLFDEGQVVIGRTVIHDGQEYIILSFSSMQRKRS